MSRFNIIAFIVPFLFCCSCLDKEYVNNVTYERIYHADSLYFRGRGVVAATCSWDKVSDEKSRQYYKDAGISLCYSGWRKRDWWKHGWSAVDWRITKIEFITNVDYDAAHPAGSSLNDVVEVWFFYMYDVVRKRLDELETEGLALTDYYRNDGIPGIFIFHKTDDSLPPLISFTIRIHDAFGRVFTLDSDQVE